MGTTGENRTVVIADDHPIVLAGLSGLLTALGGFSVLAAATDGRAALDAVMTHAPHVALLDLNMPALTGLQVVQELGLRASGTRAVIFAAAISDAEIYDAVEAGAAGIIMKSATGAQLVDSLRAIALGGTWLEPSLVKPAVERETDRRALWRQQAATLTAREAEIVRFMTDGVPNKDIAFRLGVSDGTLKVHIGNVFRKLRVTSRFEVCLLVAGQVRMTGKLPSIPRETR